jgi:hypothetical protein
LNNAFFGDRNDFCKYDLILEILEKAGFLKRFTFIPMLSPNDGRRGGRLTNYQCGSRRKNLYSFLRRCLSDNRRDIRMLRRFLPKCEFQYCPYRDSEFFTHQNRDEYFQSIPDSYLQQALVFLDPDNGFEVPSMTQSSGDRYITLQEVRYLQGRMNKKSMILVYQHLPRENREKYFTRLRNKICQELHVHNFLLISDNSVCFTMIMQNLNQSSMILPLVEAHVKRVGLQLR